MPTVTVVIPTRDRLDLLAEAVASVDRQTYRDYEIVVVDDASSDGTADWLTRGSIEGLRTIRLDSASERAASRNAGLLSACGRYVLFLDDDDRLLPEALSVLVRALEGSPDAGAAVGAYVAFDAVGNRRRASHPRRQVERQAWRDAMFHWVATPSRTLFRTSLLLEIGGFQADLVGAEDWDVTIRVTECASVVFVPDSVVEYRVHGGQSVEERELQAMERVMDRYLPTLSGETANEAVRVNEARKLYYEGSRALTALEPRVALRSLIAAARHQRGLTRSPITRPMLLPPIAKAAIGAVLGPSATKQMRRLLKAVRRRTKRDAWRWGGEP